MRKARPRGQSASGRVCIRWLRRLFERVGVRKKDGKTLVKAATLAKTVISAHLCVAPRRITTVTRS